MAGPHTAVAPRPLPDRAAPDPDRRSLRVLRGVGDGRAGDPAGRLSAHRAAATLAAAAGRAGGQPRRCRADAPDDSTGDHRAAVGAGRQLQPHPLEVDCPARRHPGQGVRPGADVRRLDLPGPRPPRPRRRRGRVDARGRCSCGRLDRRSGARREPGRWHDHVRPPPGRPARRSRWAPAPQDHAAAGRRRGRWDGASWRGAARGPVPTPPWDDGGRHHSIRGPRLGSPAGRTAGQGSGMRGCRPRRRELCTRGDRRTHWPPCRRSAACRRADSRAAFAGGRKGDARTAPRAGRV